MPVKKQYISQNTVCKLSFRLPQEIEAESACVVGDFNHWDAQSTPMTQLKSGDWKAEVKVDAGHEYRFRYLVNGNQWYNDDADKRVPNPFGEEDSVVVA